MYDLMPIEIAASGMSVQRARMGAIASNLANAHSTRQADGEGPYQRRMVVVRAATPVAFRDMLSAERLEQAATSEPQRPRYLVEQHLRGVEVAELDRDPGVRRVYDPSHPDRDADGYVTYPEISVVQEMTDMISASRGYEADLAVIQNTKDMLTKTLDILKS